MKKNLKNNDWQSETVEDNNNEESVEETSAVEKPVEDEIKVEQPVKNLVRLQKVIHFDEVASSHVDDTIVHPQFYNNFNYSLFPNGRPRGKMTFGITSPKPGDGKSLVASNLAVSLALSSESDVVLIDLNLRRPKLHKIFNTTLSPGFMESINEPTIRVVPTKIGNLSIFTAGDFFANSLLGLRYRMQEGEHSEAKHIEPAIGLEQLVEFRNIIFSLEEKFDLVIVDLPSIEESVVPTLFMKQLNGLIVVVNTGKTKKEEIDKLLKQINVNQVFGFVFNRTSSEHDV